MENQAAGILNNDNREAEMTAVNNQPNGKVIKPGKDITAAKANQIRAKLLKIMEQEINNIILDFSDVKKIDPVGLSIILAAYNTQKNTGKSLSLVNVPKKLYHLFKTIHLNRHFNLETAE